MCREYQSLSKPAPGVTIMLGLLLHFTSFQFQTSEDITDKSPENFSGHLVAADHEFGGIFARSVGDKKIISRS